MFSLRKAEIFNRRGSRMRAKEGGISSTETVYRITKQMEDSKMRRKKDEGLIRQSPVQKVHAPGGRMLRSNRVIGPVGDTE